jgi:type IV pilus assembly protein PilA
MDRLADRTRRTSKGEGGFALIELLVVMVIVGILAAIALPALLNQKTKADDAKAKEMAHTMQVAMEICGPQAGTSNVYTDCTLAAIRAIEPTIPAKNVSVNLPKEGGYTVTVTATPSENTFSITRSATGALTYHCSVLATATTRGGCPGTGVEAGTWG